MSVGLNFWIAETVVLYFLAIPERDLACLYGVVDRSSFLLFHQSIEPLPATAE